MTNELSNEEILDFVPTDTLIAFCALVIGGEEMIQKVILSWSWNTEEGRICVDSVDKQPNRSPSCVQTYQPPDEVVAEFTRAKELEVIQVHSSLVKSSCDLLGVTVEVIYETIFDFLCDGTLYPITLARLEQSKLTPRNDNFEAPLPQ